MSEEPKNTRGGPNRPKPPERFQPKVFLIWMGVILAIFVLMRFYEGPQTQKEKISPQELMQAAREGRIEALVLKGPAQNGHFEYQGTFEPDAENLPEVVDGKPATMPDNSFRGTGLLTESRIDELQNLAESDNAEIAFEMDSKPSSTVWTDLLVTLLPIALIIGLLYFLFLRQLKMAGRGAMSFGKSKAKMLQRDRDRVTFKDVAGCDEAKEEISEVVDFLKDPKKFQRIGGKVPKGVLMVGPPGTGKTLLAKAVAGEADVPFFSISGSDFVEMFVGVGAARVRDMFEQGRKNSPCIVFIDEIDAVGRQRGAGLGGGNDEREQTLNSLLVEMDGFEGHEGIIIIAATNRPDVLDQALLRPGRFDRQIMIDLPDLSGREEILRVHAKKIKLGATVDLNRVARSTSGFAGADLANLLNEAALVAARSDKSEVEPIDIEEAHDKIRFGRERRRLMDDEDKKQTAYHEAGHALLQALVDDGMMPLHKVTILPRGRALGMAMSFPKKDMLGRTRKQILNSICMAMGGRIGEEIETGDYSSGASQDIKQATAMARHMVCDWGMSSLGPVAFGDNQDHIFLGKEITRNQNYSEETARRIDEEIHKIIDAEFERARELIAEHKSALEKIAEALLEYETLEGKHVHEIIEHGEIRSEVISSKPIETHEEAKEQEAKDKKKKREEGEDYGPGTATAGAPA